MASKKKVSAFAIFLIVCAVAMTMFLSVIKNIVPVPMFIVLSLSVLYVIGFAVYMICKNRTFKWFLPENRSHKKTPAATKNSTSTTKTKAVASNADYEGDDVKVTPSTSKSRKAEPKVRPETKEAKPASKKPQATNKPAPAKKPQTTAKENPVASKKPANAETTATANAKSTEEKKTKSTSTKSTTAGTGTKPRSKPAEKAGEE